MLLAEAPHVVSQQRPATGRQRRRLLFPGWPLWAALVLYPLWWALGLGAFEFILAAIPMSITLLHRRPIRLPAGIRVWAVFLIWNLLSLVMLPAHAPDTTAGSISGRSISLLLRLIQLVTATIFLLYVVNLSPAELPQRRLVKWMAWLFIVTVGGGLLALAAPHFSYNAPFEHLLPHSFRSNQYVKSLVHPQAAQVQDVLGFQAPRPAAPWGYTNLWGNNLSILLVWFCAYLWEPAIMRNRARLAVVLLIAIVPIVYSLNRGLWFGLLLSLAFVIVRLARRGDARATMVAIATVGVGAVLFLLTPLNQVVQQRANHGASNGIRSNVDHASLKGALESPLIGWGGSRKVIGSSQSIAIGPSAKCPTCGAVNLGSTGEIWLVMFDQGLVGAFLYVGFFAVAWWRLRADRSLIGSAARLIAILSVFYTFFYNNLPTSLMLSMLSIGIACRNLHVWPTREPTGELA